MPKNGIFRIDIDGENPTDWQAAENASVNVINPYNPMQAQKKNTQRFALALIVLASALISGVAKADTITTFDISGVFDFSSSGPGTFGGTLAVDVTNGTLSSVDITFPGLADFNNVTQSHSFNGGWQFVAANSTLGELLILNFTTTMPNSLVGFSSGTITGVGVFSPSNPHTLFSAFSGTIAPATVPDQASSLALLGVGVSGLLALRRRWEAA